MNNTKEKRPISAFLKMIRGYFKHTQETTAGYLGISRTAYAHYEESSAIPPLEVLLKMSSLYSIPFYEFLVRINAEEYQKYLSNLEETNRLIHPEPEFPISSSANRCLKWITEDESFYLDYIRIFPPEYVNAMFTLARRNHYQTLSIQPNTYTDISR